MLAEVYDNTITPTSKYEYNSFVGNSDYAYNGGAFLAQAIRSNPPYSPISLISYRHAVLGSAFNENGSFFVHVLISDASYNNAVDKFTVVKFTNGSATINWNTMTDFESLP